MTSKRSPRTKIRIVSASVLFLAALAVLIALPAPAQQAGTGQPSAKASATQATVGPSQTKPHGVRATVPDSSLSFLRAVGYDSGGDIARSVAIADVNGDGKLDLIVANYCAVSTQANCAHGLVKGAVAILLGNGDGTFLPAVSYVTSGIQAFSVAAADVNGDGKLDLIVTNGYGCANTCPDGSVDVLLGNGDGTFQRAVTYDSGGSGTWSLVVADVNHDGKLDLIAANGNNDTVSVLLGKGDGTFSGAVAYASGGLVPLSIAVADVNVDGKLDIVVGNQNQNAGDGSVGVLLGNGDGTFQAVVTYDSGGTFAGSVAIMDVDGDGKADIVVTNADGPIGNGSVGVLLGNGDGTFRPSVTYDSGGQGAASVAVADVTLDGKPDLLVANFASDVGVLVGNGDGTFQAAVTYAPGGQYPLAIAAADLNGDGKPDLVVATYYAYNSGEYGSVGVLLNNTGVIQTATTLTSSLNPSLNGQPVTFTATVTSSGGTPPNGESVTFYNGVSVLGTGSLSAGIASLVTSSLPLGALSITATYGGDTNFAASISPALRQVVNVGIRSATSTTISSSLNPSIQGQPITFTATVTSSGGTPPNGETVTFYTGINVLGKAPLTGGIASLTTSGMGSGIHTISAAYLGDGNFIGSASAGLEQSVDTKGQSATTTSLASNLNPSVYGQNVTWTVTVTTTGSTTPTGTVNFNWGSDSIGTAKLNSSGVATLSKSNLNAAAYPLFAVYVGDTNNGPSASSILNQVITQATSTATITSSLNPSIQGQAVTFTATIISPTTTPTGPVTFTSGKTILGSVELSKGKATLTTTTLPVGSNPVTVTYPWNSNIAESSASVTQVVQQ